MTLPDYIQSMAHHMSVYMHKISLLAGTKYAEHMTLSTLGITPAGYRMEPEVWPSGFGKAGDTLELLIKSACLGTSVGNDDRPSIIGYCNTRVFVFFSRQFNNQQRTIALDEICNVQAIVEQYAKRLALVPVALRKQILHFGWEL